MDEAPGPERTRSGAAAPIRAGGLVSTTGAGLGLALFAASLTPSLIPRDALMQGLLGGAVFAFGYAVGAGLVALWRWLGFADARAGIRRIVRPASVLAGLVLAALALSLATEWQNSIRVLMQLPPLEAGHPLSVLAIAVGTAAALFLVGWMFRLVMRGVWHATRPWLPERAAILAAFAVAVVLFALLIDGVLVRYTLIVLDASYANSTASSSPTRRCPRMPS